MSWDNLYAEYGAQMRAEPSPRLVKLAETLSERSLVLDLGCGTGRNSLFLLKRRLKVVALDVSVNALEILKKHALGEFLAGRLSLVLADANKKLPFPSNCFDLVVDCYTFTFIRDKQKYLREIHRVLKPKGFFLLEYDMSPHIFTHDQLLDYFNQSKCDGLKVLKISRLHHAWGDVANEKCSQVPSVSLLCRKVEC